MNQLQVLLFASYADAFGASTVTVAVPDPATVADVVGALRRLPGGDVLPDAPLVAVDRRDKEIGGHNGAERCRGDETSGL